MSDMHGIRDYLPIFCEELGLLLNETRLARFERYAELLVEWNEKFNLTAITDPKGIALKHFVDSLFVVPMLGRHMGLLEQLSPAEYPPNIVDIGSGAGFPGIPIKIWFDENLHVTLIEANEKKANYLRAVIDDLGLEGIEVLRMRAEDAGRDKQYRATFRFAIARALASLRIVTEYALPLLVQGGLLFSLKGRWDAARNEIPAAAKTLRKMGGNIVMENRLFLPSPAIPGEDMNDGSDEPIERTIITIKKTTPTPPAFPRAAAAIQKTPL